MKFAVAYSGGKDCTLALDRMVQEGHKPVCLLMCMNEDGTSAMHYVRREIMKRYEQALGVPVIQYQTPSIRDPRPVCEALKRAKALGAEAMVTGDIAYEKARSRNQSVCDSVGLPLICPLWGVDREACLRELLSRGYKTVITAIWNHSVPTSYIGRTLDEALIEELKQYDIDITGENGEYHTMTTDGAVFRQPLALTLTGRVLTEYRNEYAEIE